MLLTFPSTYDMCVISPVGVTKNRRFAAMLTAYVSLAASDLLVGTRAGTYAGIARVPLPGPGAGWVHASMVG